jgi:hypothetical protein
VWDRAEGKREKAKNCPFTFALCPGIIQLKLNDKNAINKKSARRN